MAAKADEPVRWWHALFEAQTAEWIKARSYNLGLEVGVVKTHNPYHRTVGAKCTRTKWSELIRGYRPLAGDGA